jgi:hypothetical protein
MAWIPSHTDLGQHPKLKRAARIAEVSEPAMIGHLHLLWWFALQLAPDGDLSRYDADDLAIAAKYDGDPELFVEALKTCGPAGTVGFVTDTMMLHDWDDYGGKYIRKVEAGRESANRRWDRQKRIEAQKDDADAMGTQCEPNGLVMGTQWVPNTEERRVEEKRKNMVDGDTFSKRLAKDLRAEGVTLLPGSNLHETFRNLLTSAYSCYPEEKHHGITLGVIADFVRSADGPSISKEARNHTARLLKTHGRLQVFDAYGEAMQRGAGIGEKYADDPMALSKYVAAIVGGKR